MSKRYDDVDYEQLVEWLGSDVSNDTDELIQMILDIVNGDMTPNQFRKDILDYADNADKDIE